MEGIVELFALVTWGSLTGLYLLGTLVKRR